MKNLLRFNKPIFSVQAHKADLALFDLPKIFSIKFSNALENLFLGYPM